MEYRTLGRTGIKVSHWCLGAMSFGSLGNPDPTDCARIVHTALDAGINLIDTADIYSAGESERIVGQALQGVRDDVVLATKCFWPMGTDPNRRGLSRRWVMRAVEESLERLGTDWIDIYFCHKPDWDTDLEETLGAMDDLVRSGRVRAVGLSTYPAEWIVEAQWAAHRRLLTPPSVEQPPYSILVRGIESAVLPTCESHAMGTMVWGPLCGGWLTGKYRGGPPDGSRATRWGQPGWDRSRPEVTRKAEVVDALSGVADEMGVPLAHLAMAFATEHPAVTTAIIGPRTLEQLGELLPGAGVRLEDDVLDLIDELVAPGTNLDPADEGISLPWLTDPAQRRR